MVAVATCTTHVFKPSTKHDLLVCCTLYDLSSIVVNGQVRIFSGSFVACVHFLLAKNESTTPIGLNYVV